MPGRAEIGGQSKMLRVFPVGLAQRFDGRVDLSESNAQRAEIGGFVRRQRPLERRQLVESVPVRFAERVGRLIRARRRRQRPQQPLVRQIAPPLRRQFGKRLAGIVQPRLNRRGENQKCEGGEPHDAILTGIHRADFII